MTIRLFTDVRMVTINVVMIGLTNYYRDGCIEHPQLELYGTGHLSSPRVHKVASFLSCSTPVLYPHDQYLTQSHRMGFFISPSVFTNTAAD